MPKLFICTDLDRTLLPNGKQPESADARQRFSHLVSRPEVCLAYVSGRDRTLVEAAIAEYDLPLPNWVVGDVGSTIYQIQEAQWVYWESWQQAIAAAWQGLTAMDLHNLWHDLPSLTLQEPSKQSQFKLSYYLPLQVDYQSLKNVMELRLQKQSIAASLIYSLDEASAIGLLDVLPPLATKLDAIKFLIDQQGFDYANTVFAGDSGNDLSVLSSAVPAILVANAHPEVITQAQIESEQQGTSDCFYLARGGFLGMNGNYSAGILEGIAHYHPSTKDWMVT